MPAMIGGALFVVGAMIWVAVVALHGRRLLHILQLEEYDLARFWHWVRAGPDRGVPAAQVRAAIAIVVLAGAVVGFGFGVSILAGPVLLAGALYVWRARERLVAKKPLDYTPKAALIAALATALAAATVAVAVLIGLAVNDNALGVTLALVALALIGILPAVYLSAATLALYPAQAAAKRGLTVLAARRLAQRRDLIVIGITGSFGKTSTKEILATLLSSRYRVCKTAASVNTPVGIARTVLRGLQADDQVFVVEMGAYVPGNIRDLARLVHPRVGVLTAIGEQHLERFGSVDNIARTKYELIEALPADGLAVFNGDNARCRALAGTTKHVPVRCYGLHSDRGPLDVTARDIRTGPNGTEFVVCAGEAGEARFATTLLGRHNVSNVLAATAVALHLGLSLDEIARAASTLEPVAHRLQLIPGSGGVTVIDDAYNSNPAGAQAALDVLAEFPGRKVLVTPGMVELGELEAVRHAEFGRAAAAVCDSIILVGQRRTAAIAEGALAAGFAGDRLIVVPGLKEATARLGQLVGAGDAVLFENDLPDQYDEER